MLRKTNFYTVYNLGSKPSELQINQHVGTVLVDQARRKTHRQELLYLIFLR